MANSSDSSSSSSSSSSESEPDSSYVSPKKRFQSNDPSTYDADTLALYERLQAQLPVHISSTDKRSANIMRKPRTHSRSKTEFTYNHSNSSNIDSIHQSSYNRTLPAQSIHIQSTDTEHSDTSKNSTAVHTRTSSNDSADYSTIHYIESPPVIHSYLQSSSADSSDHSLDIPSNHTTPDHSPHPDVQHRSLYVGRFEVSDDGATPDMTSSKPNNTMSNELNELNLSSNSSVSHNNSHNKLDTVDESVETTHQFVVPVLPDLIEGETSDELLMAITALPDVSVSITPTGKGLEFTPCTMKFKHDSNVMSCTFRVTATSDCKPGDVCVKYVVCGSSAEDYAVPHRDILHLKCSDVDEHDHTTDTDSVHSDHSHYNNNTHQPINKDRAVKFTKLAVPQQSGRFTIVDEIDGDDIPTNDSQHLPPSHSNNSSNNSSLYMAAQATTNVALALADHVNKTYDTNNTIYAVSNSRIQLPNGTNASIQAHVSKSSNYLTPKSLNTGGSPGSSRSVSPCSDVNSNDVSPRNSDSNNSNTSRSNNNNNNTNISNTQHSSSCICIDCVSHSTAIRNSSTYSNSSSAGTGQTIGAELFGMLDPIQMMSMLQDRFVLLQTNNMKLLDENTQLKAELQQLRDYKAKHQICVNDLNESNSDNKVSVQPSLARATTTPTSTDTSKTTSITAAANITKPGYFQTNIQPLSKSNNHSSSSNNIANKSPTQPSNNARVITISPPSPTSTSNTVKPSGNTSPNKSSSRATNSTLNSAIFNSNSVTMTQTTTSLQLNSKNTSDRLSVSSMIDKNKPLTSTTTTTTTTIPIGHLTSSTSDLLEQLSNKCITSLTQQHSSSRSQTPSPTTSNKQLDDKVSVERSRSLDV